MCLCLHGLDFALLQTDRNHFTSLFIFWKSNISSFHRLNDVYSWSLQEKWVSLRHSEDFMSITSLCFSWLGPYQQYFLAVIPPAVNSLVIWPHSVQWSNRAIIQPREGNKMWTQATWRATWVCVCVCVWTSLSQVQRKEVAPFWKSILPSTAVERACVFSACARLCMSFLIAGWGNPFPSRLTSHKAWGAAHARACCAPTRTHTRTAKENDKQLEKLNKRPLLGRAGSAQQDLWRGWMSLSS